MQKIAATNKRGGILNKSNIILVSTYNRLSKRIDADKLINHNQFMIFYISSPSSLDFEGSP